MSIATREFLRDYWSGLKKLPDLVKHISFSRRSLEQELQEVRGALADTLLPISSTDERGQSAAGR